MYVMVSIERIADLQQLIADFASIDRTLNLANKSRFENDVDHSFGLALTAWFLAQKIAPDLNLQEVFKYALAHDIVEIHAGDTFLFGPSEYLASKSDRENAALERLATEWPDFPELIEYARGYKEHRDEEAKFVYALDKLLPILMVNLGEKSVFWNRHKITKETLIEKKKRIKVSKYMKPYYDELIKLLEDSNDFYKEKPTSSRKQG